MSKRCSRIAVFCCCASFWAASFFSEPSLVRADVVRLTTDARLNPVVGIATGRPEFGWELETPAFYDVRQLAFSVDVASTREKLAADAADLWKSGEISGDRSTGVRYDGARLESSRRYFWRVSVRWTGADAVGKSVDKTETADGEFVTGILAPADWNGASWISSDRTDADPLPILFRDFELEQPYPNVSEAFLHVCGLGQQIVSVNGSRVGDRTSIDPGWTNYRKTCLYATFDVLGELERNRFGGDRSERRRSLSVFLGNGMFNVPGGRYVKFTGSFGLPKAIAKLVVRYRDGSTQTVVTDENWKTLPTPLVFSCVYGGDDVDFALGRLTRDGLVARGVAKKAVVVDGPGGELRAQEQPPVVVLETLKPIETKTLDDGKIEANFGFNFAGRPVVRVFEKWGDKIDVTVAETKGNPWGGHSDSYKFPDETPENAAATTNASEIAASSDYSFKILSGIEPQTELVSTFGYWGFQYVYVEGGELGKVSGGSRAADKKTRVVEIAAERIGADLERVGSFDSDGANLNDVDLMIDRSIRSNIVSLTTDCPHREKLGWLEQTHLMGPSILYRYNLQTLFRKICRDMTEAQFDDGMIPDIAPEYTRFAEGFLWSAEWSSAAVQVPWLLYRWYGDTEIVERQYDTMDKYVRYLASTRDEKGLAKAGLGDWYDWSPEKSHFGRGGYSQHTPGELTATAFLCDDARIMSVFAELLGKADDAKFYRELQATATADFQKAFYDPETNVVATGSQASYAFALYFHLVPEADRGAVFANLLADIEKWEYRPSVGEVAWRFLIRTLADAGRSDVLWKMIQRENAPGYVHMLKHWGMKTLSETWDGPGSSMNHFMFGAIQEWFSSNIVGISQTDESLGFREIVLRPEPMQGKIGRAKGDYRSIYGKIVSDWRLVSEPVERNADSGNFVWNVVVPAGSTARLEIPVYDENSVVRFERFDEKTAVPFAPNGETTFEAAVGDGSARRVATVGSGRYRIVSELSAAK